MKKFSQIAMLFLVGSFYSACAEGPTFRDMNLGLVSDQPEYGRIFFYRPSSFETPIQPEVILNKERVGVARPWEFFYVDRPPGDYKVTITSEVEFERVVSFSLKQGQTRFIRFSSDSGFIEGQVFGELVEESVGLKEIQDCLYFRGKD